VNEQIGKKILVVEDEPAIGRMCQKVLTGQGFEVRIAANGRVAQDMVKREQYHCCLIDIMMPEEGGTEFYGWLQQQYPELARGVVFTTGSLLDEKIMAFIKQSGRLFLPKPFTPGELKAIVAEALKQLEK